jgi:ribosomal protein S18 acetylase RimI-like enzyme
LTNSDIETELYRWLCISVDALRLGDRKVLEIRQAGKSDIPDLVDLDDECFDTYYYEKTKFGRSEFRAYLCCKKSVLLVAVRDSHLVGYVAGTVRTSGGRSIAHLDSIAVSSTVRRKGIGSRLLHFFIQGAKQQACEMVMLEVATANKDGLRFFWNRGFLKISDLSGYYGPGLDGVLMGLSIGTTKQAFSRNSLRSATSSGAHN